MRKFVKISLFILVSIIAIGSGLYLTGTIYAPKGPAKIADNMEKSIAFARRHSASRYASQDFNDCIALHRKTMKEWKAQNELWIIRRDYSRVRSLIVQTTDKAVIAGKKAIEKSGSMTQFIKETTASLIERDNYFTEKFRVLPLEKALLAEHSEAHLLLKEAIEASGRGDLNSAFKKLSVAYEDFSQLELNVRKKLDDYFKSYSVWERWYQQTVEKSRDNKCYAIIVDKMAHECILLKDGKVIDRFEAELSLNWIGHKRYQGDNATPEGIYKITKKVNKKDTKYYKALLLNYPNENDVARFEKDIRQGSLEPSARIGGLIEIHGDGGKGKDWTEGCVALENKDIDKLYTMVNAGTTVTIVGSLTPLQELFN
jgi:hypothetical protein